MARSGIKNVLLIVLLAGSMLAAPALAQSCTASQGSVTGSGTESDPCTGTDSNDVITAANGGEVVYGKAGDDVLTAKNTNIKEGNKFITGPGNNKVLGVEDKETVVVPGQASYWSVIPCPDGSTTSVCVQDKVSGDINVVTADTAAGSLSVWDAQDPAGIKLKVGKKANPSGTFVKADNTFKGCYDGANTASWLACPTSTTATCSNGKATLKAQKAAKYCSLTSTDVLSTDGTKNSVKGMPSDAEIFLGTGAGQYKVKMQYADNANQLAVCDTTVMAVPSSVMCPDTTGKSMCPGDVVDALAVTDDCGGNAKPNKATVASGYSLASPMTVDNVTYASGALTCTVSYSITKPSAPSAKCPGFGAKTLGDTVDLYSNAAPVPGRCNKDVAMDLSMPDGTTEKVVAGGSRAYKLDKCGKQTLKYTAKNSFGQSSYCTEELSVYGSSVVCPSSVGGKRCPGQDMTKENQFDNCGMRAVPDKKTLASDWAPGSSQKQDTVSFSTASGAGKCTVTYDLDTVTAPLAVCAGSKNVRKGDTIDLAGDHTFQEGQCSKGSAVELTYPTGETAKVVPGKAHNFKFQACGKQTFKSRVANAWGLQSTCQTEYNVGASRMECTAPLSVDKCPGDALEFDSMVDECGNRGQANKAAIAEDWSLENSVEQDAVIYSNEHASCKVNYNIRKPVAPKATCPGWTRQTHGSKVNLKEASFQEGDCGHSYSLTVTTPDNQTVAIDSASDLEQAYTLSQCGKNTFKVKAENKWGQRSECFSELFVDGRLQCTDPLSMMCPGDSVAPQTDSCGNRAIPNKNVVAEGYSVGTTLSIDGYTAGAEYDTEEVTYASAFGVGSCKATHKVQKPTAPTVKCPGFGQRKQGDSINLFQGQSTSGNCGGAHQFSVVTPDGSEVAIDSASTFSYQLSTCGKQTFTYKASNKWGLKAQCTETVDVTCGSTPPTCTATCPTTGTLNVCSGDSAGFLKDSCGNNVAPSSAFLGTVNSTTDAWTETVSYSITDKSGKKSTCKVNYGVRRGQLAASCPMSGQWRKLGDVVDAVNAFKTTAETCNGKVNKAISVNGGSKVDLAVNGKVTLSQCGENKFSFMVSDKWSQSSTCETIMNVYGELRCPTLSSTDKRCPGSEPVTVTDTCGNKATPSKGKLATAAGVDTVTYSTPAGTCAMSYSVKEATAPAIECGTVSGKAYAGQTVTLSTLATASSGNCGSLKSMSFRKNKATTASTLSADSTTKLSCGTNTFEFSVVDSLGQTATCTTAVTAIDRIKPSLKCAAPMTVSAGDEVPLAPRATDNCGKPTVAVTRVSRDGMPMAGSLPSGSFVPDVPGTYAVTYSASDASGNKATCTQSIIVQ